MPYRIAVAMLLSVVAEAAPAQTSTCYVGSIGTGRSLRRAVLELTSSTAPGSALTILQRTVDTRRASTVRHDASAISVELGGGATPAQLTATLSPDGGLNGTFKTAASSAPVSFLPSTGADRLGELRGYWLGHLETNSIPVRVALKFLDAPCGQIHVMLDSPDQSAINLPMTSARLTGDSLHLEAEYLNAVFRGVRGKGSTLSGTWTQAGAPSLLTVTRSDSASANRRPQDPLPPFPYESEELRVAGSGGVRLAGTLTRPRSGGPHPAILLLSGSGAQDRNETVAGHRPFLVIADRLTRAGFAVLRLDDRGIGGSTGKIVDASFDDLAGDALAAIAQLSARPDIDARRIGLLGHSEGGWIAPLIASRSPNVAFMVLLAAPAAAGDTVLLVQQEALSRAAGEPDATIQARRAASKALYAILREERDSAVIGRRQREAIDALRTSSTGAVRAAYDSLYGPKRSAEMATAWAVLTTPWFHSLVRYDPTAILERTKIPVLGLYGDRDLQVPPSLSAPALERALRTGGNRDVTVRVFPGLNHLLQTAKTGLPDEYIQIEETIAPPVLETIVEWLGVRFQSRPRADLPR